MANSTDIESQLRAHGVKPTSQRLKIGGLLLSSPQHLSADQILFELRRRGSGISKATVYNTLNLFLRHGLVREVMVDANRTYYDSTTGSHHHFYNVDTGQLIDIPASELQVRGLPPLPPGTETADVEVIVRIRNKTATGA